MPTPNPFVLVLAQCNPVVGDLRGAVRLALEAQRRARDAGAHAVAFSELFLSGYPPDDLVLRPEFQKACRSALHRLARDAAEGPALIVGTPWKQGDKLHNAVAVLDKGEVQALRFKVKLPNSHVFDEARVFSPGPMPEPVEVRGVSIGLPICEDVWSSDVCGVLADKGARMLVVPNGSPFLVGKNDQRLARVRARAKETGLDIAYVNQFGGQDELVFDGGSFVMTPSGALAALAPWWKGALLPTFWRADDDKKPLRCDPVEPLAAPLDDEEHLYNALMLGLRDYAGKNGFQGVALGLSGGIDSALVAALAVDALGPDAVRCLAMPSAHSSRESLLDAQQCAAALGARLDVVPISSVVDAFQDALAPVFDNLPPDVAEENVQARTRGVLLMALCNKHGLMLVSTGNKSEMAVGYATLYGDMNGAFNPLKDVYKTRVYQLARWRNSFRPSGALGPAGQVVPDAVLTKAPTAELRPDQKDEDTLPPYPVLDAVLSRLIDAEDSVDEVVADAVASREVVVSVARMVSAAEHKRRQAPPGVVAEGVSFGRARRYPITNRFGFGEAASK